MVFGQRFDLMLLEVFSNLNDSDSVKRFFPLESGWVLKQTPQACGHSTKHDRDPEAFGQRSQAHGGIPGAPCAGLAVGFYDPCGSLPIQGSLRFY